MTVRSALLVEIRDLLRELVDTVRGQQRPAKRPRRALPVPTPDDIERARRRLHRAGVRTEPR